MACSFNARYCSLLPTTMSLSMLLPPSHVPPLLLLIQLYHFFLLSQHYKVYYYDWINECSQSSSVVCYDPFLSCTFLSCYFWKPLLFLVYLLNLLYTYHEFSPQLSSFFFFFPLEALPSGIFCPPPPT